MIESIKKQVDFLKEGLLRNNIKHICDKWCSYLVKDVTWLLADEVNNLMLPIFINAATFNKTASI